jgi:hypothetical protein
MAGRWLRLTSTDSATMSILTAYNIRRQLPTVPGSGTGIRARVAKHTRAR